MKDDGDYKFDQAHEDPEHWVNEEKTMHPLLKDFIKEVKMTNDEMLKATSGRDTGELCPKCKSPDVVDKDSEGSLTQPECYWKECIDCDNQWDHH